MTSNAACVCCLHDGVAEEEGRLLDDGRAQQELLPRVALQAHARISSSMERQTRAVRTHVPHIMGECGAVAVLRTVMAIMANRPFLISHSSMSALPDASFSSRLTSMSTRSRPNDARSAYSPA